MHLLPVMSIVNIGLVLVKRRQKKAPISTNC